MQTTTITKGDTLLPMNSVIYASAGNPMDLGSYTVKVLMVNKDDSSDVVVNELTTGVTAHPTQNFTASATSDLLSCNAHGLTSTDQVVVSTSGTLPGGLAASTRYFPVQITPNSFALAELPNGSPIDITSTGSGTHAFYVVGSVQYDWQSGNVDETGDYYFHFRIYSGSERVTAPHDGDTWLIHIVAPSGV
jgi:hypothetical protein